MPPKKSTAKKTVSKKPATKKNTTSKKTVDKKPDASKKSNNKNTSQAKRSTFKNPWFYSTIILLIIFAGVILYNKSFVFHERINSILGLENTITQKVPPIQLTVINDKEITNMPYDMDEQILSLKEEIDSEINVTKIDISEDKAKELIVDLNIKTLPVLIFDESLADTSFYSEAIAFFTPVDGYYIMRVKPVKFLEIPEAGDGQVKGVATEPAPVTIIAYNSFSCPYCNMMKDVFYQALEEYPDEVNYVYKHFNRGGSDLVLSNSAECAGEQDKFWEMHDYLFENLEQLRNTEIEAFLTKAADKLSLDKMAFDTCLAENRYADLINEQTTEAYKYGINGTPGIFINDTFVGGAVEYDRIKEIITSFIQ